MPRTDRERLGHSRSHSRLTDLWLALTALRSCTSLLQSGAHPDDETSEMLAALRFRDGLSLSYACSTRGEGGQNDIGTASGADLGALRTAEMERAAESLDMRLWWLPSAPDDSLVDFGFSKSGEETLERWGRSRTLARFVHVIRSERPDILIPTFLDVPGQHGHHRAMTQAAHLAFDAAADPGFDGSDLPVWAVSKLYLPAWGGGGAAYDDEVPPPAATVTVTGTGDDPVTGWSWAEMGQHSRMFHRTQGMGRWAGEGHDWPLHLARSRVGDDAGALTDNLPRNLADLGLAGAQDAMDAAVAAFPGGPQVIAAAARALTLIRTATPGPGDAHRLALKERQLTRVLHLAAGIRVAGTVADDWLAPGGTTAFAVETRAGTASALNVSTVLPDGWSLDGERLVIGPDVPPSDPCPETYDPLVPSAPALRLTARIGGLDVTRDIALDSTPQVVPTVSATPAPAGLLLNLAAPTPLATTLTALRGTGPTFDLPDGWTQDWTGNDVALGPPPDLPPGLTDLPLHLSGAPARSAHRLSAPHTGPRLRTTPAVLRVRAAHIALPDVRVGYVGGGNDAVPAALAAMGMAVTSIDDDALAGTSPFDALDSLIVGVFAFRFRPALTAALPALHAWTRAGGTLVTLYHRPWDAWDADATPPAHLEIGQPSLRWRVTDETAQVTHLAPDHPVLTAPNVIGPEDWDGWVKERGLYFAKSWDDAYVPLVSMADPGEAPHHGALLSADIGTGRHSHVALGLHLQMAALVPGGFRLMANLLARR